VPASWGIQVKCGQPDAPDTDTRMGGGQMAELLGHSPADLSTAESDLPARYAAGDENSLSALYDGWSSVIFTSARLSTPAKALRVTIDTFVSLWQRHTEFPASQLTLRGWVRLVGRERLTEGGCAALDRLLLSDEVAGFGDPGHRIMELMLTQRMSHRQVAALLSLPNATVRSELRRATEKLRAVVAPEAPALRDLGVAHLAPETLTLRAFGEQVGLPHEHALDDAHLATCVRCQETLLQLGDVVATATLIDPAEHLQVAPPQVWSALASRLLLPLAAPLAEDVAPSPTPSRSRSRRH
jgi:hypothetical protein